MIQKKIFINNPYYFIEILSLVFGALLPLSFAPYEFFWLQFPLLVFIFLSCLEQKPSIAFRRGFFFGLGWFVHGIYWLYYSLHIHGGMPIVVTAITIILLSAYMALFPAFSLYLTTRFIKTSRLLMLALVYPISWMIFDWFRGYFLTGFPWVQIGIAHIDTYLIGYAPIIGGLGVGLVVTIIAGLLALSIIDKSKRKVVIGVIASLYLSGFILSKIEWTVPTGEPIKVSMIQGNIVQAEKWERKNYRPTLQMYRELIYENWDSDLIILPETAIPSFRSRVKIYLSSIAEDAEKNNTDIILGIFVRDSESAKYYNSVITLDDQIYRKRHLVPLGEYFPFRSVLGFFQQWVDIPMSDIANGEDEQALLKVAGQTIGLSICFEDAFDRSVLLDLPEATLLVNVSNDAWFEDSTQSLQHHQIARMRAVETGRMLLRVTNTGVSSIIDQKGNVLARSPQFEQHVIKATVRGYFGMTLYVVWANYLLIMVGLLFLAILMKNSNTKV